MCLLALAFFNAMFMALLDPFLNLWDEQFHALVAKNLADDPLRPVLYRDSLWSHNAVNWTANEVWLHKPPAFLWLMSASIKIFGAHAWAARIPSVLLFVCTTFFIYRAGKISINRHTAFAGALFFSCAYYPLELVAGGYPTDHNDVAFMCFVTAGLWAWLENSTREKWYWPVLIGIFSGLAVLTKWLPGLLVFACWGLAMIPAYRALFSARRMRPLIISLVCATVVALPWQLYARFRFPQEFMHELSGHAAHLTHTVEGHAGNLWFHITAMKFLYGEGQLMPFIVLAGLLSLLMMIRKIEQKIFLVSSVLVVYVFFSLASTKMVSFCAVISPVVFLGIGALCVCLIEKAMSIVEGRIAGKTAFAVSVVVVAFLFFNHRKIAGKHTVGDIAPADYVLQKQEEMKLIEVIREQLPVGRFAIYGTGTAVHSHIPIMFFTDHLAYPGMPGNEEVRKARKLGYDIAVLDNGQVPDSILMKTDVQINYQFISTQ